MIAALDVGNTQIKVGLFQKGELTSFKRYLHSEIKELEKFLSSQGTIEKIGLSDVTGKSGHWEILLNSDSVININSFLSLPFKVNYDTPQTLGSDRLCLAAGTIQQLDSEEGALVIGTGTCITYDYITSEHQYVGGAISPGLHMRYKALHTLTEKLPLVESTEQSELIGTNTQSSIHSGVYQGMLLEMQGRIDAFQASTDRSRVYITGGDAETFVGGLKNRIFADNFLLLKGIREIVEYQAIHTKNSN